MASQNSRNRARHALIVDAIEWMVQGTYGTCLTCGAPIPYGRLIVFPEARTCAVCGSLG